MLLLEGTLRADTSPRKHLVALFGVGLIGRSILDALGRRGPYRATFLPLQWNCSSHRYDEIQAIENVLLSSLKGNERVDFVWAAGSGGFAAAEAVLAAEQKSLEDVVGLIVRLRTKRPAVEFCFHLMSSAGGLFEGQRTVDSHALPMPHRPYGMAKLAQEKCVASIPGIHTLIYRPSSVYGFAGQGVRVGLVNAIVENAARHAVTRIFGEPSTVRDFVLASDVGVFIANRLVEEIPTPGVFLLASGKPSSLNEIIQRIRGVLGRKFYINFDPMPTNAKHITFQRSALPTDWRPTDLETGVRITAFKLHQAIVAPKLNNTHT